MMVEKEFIITPIAEKTDKPGQNIKADFRNFWPSGGLKIESFD